MKTDLEQWLDTCPAPVIGRVIEDYLDLNHLAYSSHLYQENMLVCCDIRALRKEDPDSYHKEHARLAYSDSRRMNELTEALHMLGRSLERGPQEDLEKCRDRAEKLARGAIKILANYLPN